MSRPAVDVVVPFAGSDAALSALQARLGALELRAGDSLVVVDNRPGAPDAGDHVIGAGAKQSSYYARNRGAERGSSAWLLFLDGDVNPPADLIDRYFDTEPGDRAGVVAGGMVDAPLTGAPTRAERYAVEAEQMSQENTLRAGPWSYAQTANTLVRREAFAQVGGFEEGIRSGGDADLCFRLRVAGWELESRPQATVVHENRAGTKSFLRQKARHGSGIAWLNRRYPGSFPPRDRVSYAKWFLRELAAAARTTASGNPGAAADSFFPVLVIGAFELGRLLPNRGRGG